MLTHPSRTGEPRMASDHAPQEWKDWSEWLAAGIDGRSRWRLPLVMMGMVFGHGRRVVAA